jgi:tRNA (guanine37-N1)-methyltransferase
MELLAGEDNYVTRTKENSYVFELDFSKVYWNTRLGKNFTKLSYILQPS